MRESPDPAVHLHRGAALELVRQLKTEAGKDIWLCGGGRLAAAVFTEIDELILKINPVLIGTGIPLFHGAAGTRATLLTENKAYPNGFVLAHYDCSPQESARSPE
jgi:dihydrofolate reductase